MSIDKAKSASVTGKGRVIPNYLSKRISSTLVSAAGLMLLFAPASLSIDQTSTPEGSAEQAKTADGTPVPAPGDADSAGGNRAVDFRDIKDASPEIQSQKNESAPDDIDRLIADGKLNQAISVLEKRVQSAPDDVASLTSLAKTYLQAGRYRNCIASCNHALKLQPSLVAVLLNKAEAEKRISKFKLAIEDCSRVLTSDPKKLEAYLIRAYSEAKQYTDTKKARIDVDKALALDPSSSEAHTVNAFVIWNTTETPPDNKQTDIAIRLKEAFQLITLRKEKTLKELAKAEELDSKNADVYALRAQVDVSDAKDLQKAIQLAPYRPEFCLDLAQSRLFKSVEMARDEIARALAIDPECADAYVLKSATYSQEALKATITSLGSLSRFSGASAPQTPEQMLKQQEQMRAQMDAVKRPYQEKALKNMTQALEIDPANSDYLSNRALIQISLRNKDQALKDASRAIEIDPSSTGAYMTRAIIYQGLGNMALAKKDREMQWKTVGASPAAIKELLKGYDAPATAKPLTGSVNPNVPSARNAPSRLTILAPKNPKAKASANR